MSTQSCSNMIVPPANTDESKVPLYTLPELSNFQTRRQEILHLFSSTMYGHSPQTGWKLTAKIDREDPDAYSGLVIRQETLITITTPHGSLNYRALVMLPKAIIDCGRKAPGFIGLNFSGNHTTTPDPWVTIPTAWAPDRPKEDFSSKNTEAGRGCLARRWPVLRAISAGFAVVTIFSGELDEDRDDQFVGGIHKLFQDSNGGPLLSWGTIAAWAWGLSRTLDALIEVEPRLDHTRVGTIGHSRMGKAALWAAAQDERFAWAISNNSGCAGAALSRRCFGERLVNINTRFPHWFCGALKEFNERENELPVDQHQLLALIAPRPLYVASASLDKWADPMGEFASCVAASLSFEQLGKKGFETDAVFPPLNTSIGDWIGYHCRPGEHDITEVDWVHYFNIG